MKRILVIDDDAATRDAIRAALTTPYEVVAVAGGREALAIIDCEQFDLCHQRGRCFYSAALQQGSLYGPHESCPYVHGSSAVLPVVT